MKDMSFSEFLHNGITVYQKTESDENGVTISQSRQRFVSPKLHSEDEVTHEVFFGENLKRVRKVFGFILCIVIFSSCATYKPVTHFEQPVITISDSNLCVSSGLSALINHDSLFYYLDKGLMLGGKENNVKIYWQPNTTDPLNGQVVVEPHLCLNNSDFCLIGQYWIQVPQNVFYAKLREGMTFGTPSASVFVIYQDGKLVIRPMVCIKTKVTARSLK